jgi:hypothetical protein
VVDVVVSNTTAGRELLDLTCEYRDSVEARSDDYADVGGTPTGRDPEVIAAEYATALRSFITGSSH